MQMLLIAQRKWNVNPYMCPRRFGLEDQLTWLAFNGENWNIVIHLQTRRMVGNALSGSLTDAENL